MTTSTSASADAENPASTLSRGEQAAQRAEQILDLIITAKGGSRRAGQVHMARSVARALEEQVPLLIEGGTGIGKALDVDTLIPTALGWKRMGDIAVGDWVFSELGRLTQVLGVSPIQHDRTCYEITFSDGTTIVCDAEHVWVTLNRAAQRKARGKFNLWDHGTSITTDCMLASMSKEEDASKAADSHAIPLALPLENPEASLAVDPYALGLWLAGTTGAQNTATLDGELATLVDQVDRDQFDITMDGRRLRLTPTSEGRALLVGLGVADGAAHIPEAYLFASLDQRTALLQGLLDVSGYVAGQPASASGGRQVQFTDRRERLAQDVHTLIASLGYRPTIRCRDDAANTRGVRVVCFSPAVTLVPGRAVFCLSRKSESLGALQGNGRGRGTYRLVSSIREVPSRPVRCIAVDSPSHLYLAGRSMVPTHNSIGYLTGALASGRTVAVAPHTKALQDQLRQDLDLISSAVSGSELVDGAEITGAVIKGRSSYACLLKLKGDPNDTSPPEPLEGMEGAEEESKTSTPSSVGAEIVALNEWVDKTETGDRADLPFPVSSKAWQAASVSASECIGKSCFFYQNRTCFAEVARDQAKEASIVVVNQAFLAAAMMIPPLMPENVDAVVVDEAHEFPSVVSEAFGASVTERRLSKAASTAASSLASVSTIGAKQLEAANRKAKNAVERLVKEIPVPESADRDALNKPAAAKVLKECLDAFSGLNSLASRMPEGEVSEKNRKLLVTRMLGNLVFDLRLLTMGTTDKQVAWIEPKDGRINMRSAQFDVAETIFSRLIEPTRSVTFTSATLTVANRFDHPASTLGATMGPWSGETVASPFDYTNQGLLWLPDGMPAPNSKEYSQAVGQVAEKVIQAAGGRTLILCTSRASVLALTEYLTHSLGSKYPVLSQGGDATPKEIARQFTEDPRSILIGTRTFWTGISVEGDTCASVVIDKIPFPSPGDPVFAARSEKADREEGRGTGFRTVSLVEACVSTVQGAGRAIRTVNDRGVVVMCDPRLNPQSEHAKSYGRTILKSLPPFPVTHDETKVMDFLREIDRTADDTRAVMEIEEAGE